MNSKPILIKKPQQQRSKQKVEAIYAALTRILQQQSFARITTAEIALEAELSIGSLYDYFGNKESILIGYIDRQLSLSLQQIQQQAEQAQLSANIALQALLRGGIQFALQEQAAIRALCFTMPQYLSEIDLHRSKAKIEQISVTFAKAHRLHIPKAQQAALMFSLSNIVLGYQFRLAILEDCPFSEAQLVAQLEAIIAPLLFSAAP